MKSVVIIGAGPAGLTAAHSLLTRSRDFDVVILEASPDIGGISKTIIHNGNRMDVGGHRFFSKNREIMQWWQSRLPLQGAPAKDDLILRRTPNLALSGPDPELADKVMLLRNRVSRIFFARHFFDYPLRIKPATFINMGVARTIRVAISYLWASIRKRPENSLEDFYINRFGRTLYAMFFESYTEKVWGIHPAHLAADWGAQRVKGLSVLTLLKDGFINLFGLKKAHRTETSLIEEFWYPKFGPGQLWEQVAAEVEAMGGRIQRNCAVNRIHCRENAVSAVDCVTHTGERRSVDASIVISSMPLKDLTVALDLEKPDRITEIAAGLPYRDFITVGLLVKRMKLKNNTNIKTLGGIVPDCWIYIQEPDVRVGRLQIFNNWSPYLVKDPVNTVWIGMEYFCSEGDELWRLPEREMIALAVSELVAMDIIASDEVLDTHCEKIRKAYPAYFGSYDEIDVLREWLTGIEGLYCVGRNGQHRYNNMDHSMMTSFFCVDHILDNTGCKRDIWNINIEQNYHEVSKNDN